MRAQERVGLARFEVTEGTRENRCAGTTNASDSCFTGKEEDIDVGLTYFGKRYLSPYLNRWISADPLAVHVPGEADLNVYAYVSGQALKATDPLGLQAVCNPDKPQEEARRAGTYNARLDLKLERDVEDAYRRYSSRIPDGATAKEIESLHARFIAEVNYLVDQNAAAKAAVPTDPALRRAYDEGYGPNFAMGVVYRLFQAVVENLPMAGKAGRGRAGVPGQERPPRANPEPPVEGPKEPYNRLKHYGRTPTKADRKAAGAGEGQVVDHDPPLVQRYYEGDPKAGEKPGYQMTPAERKASANDRTRHRIQTSTESNRQGNEMQKYSRGQKKKWNL